MPKTAALCLSYTYLQKCSKKLLYQGGSNFFAVDKCKCTAQSTNAKVLFIIWSYVDI